MWTVPVFDRRKAAPLPFENRHLILDWNVVPDGEQLAIRSMVIEQRRSRPQLPPFGTDETVITLASAAPARSQTRWLKYRELFAERSIEELDQEINGPSPASTHSVDLDGYIEDENGKPITMQDVADHLVGGHAVIMDDPASVLRVGPVGIKEPSAWQPRDSDLVAQFLRVVEHIGQSAWFRCPTSVSWLHRKDGVTDVQHCIFPKPSEISEVLAWVRQIYSSDNLFVHACNLYLRQVDNHAKRLWIAAVRDSFNKLRNDKPWPSKVTAYNRQQLIDLLAYGARILHRKSDNDSEGSLAELIRDFGREMVVFAIDGSMRDLIGQAVLAYHPIKQDFHHWLTAGFIPQPTILDLRDVLRSS